MPPATVGACTRQRCWVGLHAHLPNAVCRLEASTTQRDSYTEANSVRSSDQPAPTWSANVPVPSTDAHHIATDTTYGSSYTAKALGPQPSGATRYPHVPNTRTADYATTYGTNFTDAGARPQPQAQSPMGRRAVYEGVQEAGAKFEGRSQYNATFQPPSLSTAALLPVAGEACCYRDEPSACVEVVTSTGNTVRQYTLTPNPNKLDTATTAGDAFTAPSARNLRCSNQWTAKVPHPYTVVTGSA